MIFFSVNIFSYALVRAVSAPRRDPSSVRGGTSSMAERNPHLPVGEALFCACVNVSSFLEVPSFNGITAVSWKFLGIGIRSSPMQAVPCAALKLWYLRPWKSLSRKAKTVPYGRLDGISKLFSFRNSVTRFEYNSFLWRNIHQISVFFVKNF